METIVTARAPRRKGGKVPTPNQVVTPAEAETIVQRCESQVDACEMAGRKGKPGPGALGEKEAASTVEEKVGSNKIPAA